MVSVMFFGMGWGSFGTSNMKLGFDVVWGEKHPRAGKVQPGGEGELRSRVKKNRLGVPCQNPIAKPPL